LLRLGFEPEGYLRGHVQRAGERRDCLIFGLLL
jgi:RimJ/RimL family protein N-acetyltransferase